MIWTAYVDLAAKVALPILGITATYYPRTQMALSGAVCACSTAAVIYKPPYVDSSMNACVQVVKLLQMVAFACGFISLLCNDPDSLVPPILFYALSPATAVCAVLYTRFACRRAACDKTSVAGFLYEPLEQEDRNL
mmetsp:Transcript_104983/g.292413  ORF Transcript_104983/g.292413 Transcript_104983/m.292413 type:complete len:136 (-) Transcript_104983:25-432(-)